jgi:NADPH:quinone reductase-like Zn-dependent oxidoreductase
LRAVLLTGHGDLDRLEYRSDVPQPRAGRGEVLLRIAAAAVNNTDINARIAWYSRATHAQADDAGWTGSRIEFPRIQGADACGYIEAVGEGVDPARIGERVIVDPVMRSRVVPNGPPVYFGSDCDGSFAEFAVVPAENACAIDSALKDAELASFPCSYLAAENMLSRAAVKRGERVLITGASGGVGSAAVQLAVRRGAEVTAVAGRSKLAEIAGLGAARVLDRNTNFVAELGRGSIDAILDSVGGQQFSRQLSSLRRGGRCAIAGAIAAPVAELDLRTVYLNDLQIIGCTIPEPGLFKELVGYIERGEIKPLISGTYPLHKIRAAQTAFMTKSHVGKIILIPG